MPDSNTIWTFREHLTQGDVVKELFERFGKELNKHGLIFNKGKIIDATIVQVPDPFFYINISNQDRITILL